MNKRKSYIIISLFFVVMMVFPINVKAESKDSYINYVTIESSQDITNRSFALIAAEVDCNDTILGCTDDEDSVAWLLQKLLNYLKILGPTIAIVLGSLDFTKAIVASDEDQMKKTQSKFVKRIIAAVLLFFIPLLVEILLSIFGIVGTTGGLN